MKNTVQVHHKGGKQTQSSQVKTGNHDIIQRPVSYDQVSEFIDGFYYLEHARDEVSGLLALGVSLFRLQAKDDATSKVADNYVTLVSAATHKLAMAINEIHQSVFNIEPRVDDPWRTAAEMKAKK